MTVIVYNVVKAKRLSASQLYMLNQITLRTPENQKRYMEFLKTKFNKKCIFCHRDLLVKEFDNFILVKNRFPYDRVYKNHWMLAPKRHIQEMYELNMEETAEMWKILESDELEYNQIIINKRGDRSILNHFHIHIVSIK